MPERMHDKRACAPALIASASSSARWLCRPFARRPSSGRWYRLAASHHRSRTASPPCRDASGEFAIRAARSFDIPLSFRASYCFSFLTLGRLSGIAAPPESGLGSCDALGDRNRQARNLSRMDRLIRHHQTDGWGTCSVERPAAFHERTTRVRTATAEPTKGDGDRQEIRSKTRTLTRDRTTTRTTTIDRGATRQKRAIALRRTNEDWTPPVRGTHAYRSDPE